VENSTQPVVGFTFTLHKGGDIPVHGWLGGALQNSVGWDGVTPIDGVACGLCGRNTNRARQRDGWTSLVLENTTLPADHPGSGQLVLGTDGPALVPIRSGRRRSRIALPVDTQVVVPGKPLVSPSDR
jgi:non-lysosomal glucosylceramidase